MKKNYDTRMDKVAEKIAGATANVQTKFANILNKLVSIIPQRSLKIVLILFCLIAGGFSVYLASEAIFGTQQVKTVFEVKPIHVPKHYDKTGSEVKEREQLIPEALYDELQAYKRTMDSLGQPIRKGLADSIKMLEEIYLSQKK
jgi:hypothetical protein